MPRLLLLLVLSLALLGACSGHPPNGIPRWTHLEDQTTLPAIPVEDYHLDAMKRAHESLESHHLLEAPWTHKLVGYQRDAFLSAVGRERWLGEAEIQALRDPAILGRWKAALSGENLGIAVEVAQVATRRNQGTDAWDGDAIVQALLSARASGLDPHTRHVPPEVVSAFNDHMLRMSNGMGVGFRWENEAMVVRRIEPDSPAGRSGLLREGDVLEEVRLKDGEWREARPPETVLAWFDEAVDRVDVAVRREGKRLRLTIPMPSAEEKKAFGFDEDKVRAHPEQWEKGDAAFSVMRVELTLLYENGHDGHDASVDVAAALKQAHDLEMDAVVLDLRRCRGGSVGVAVKTAGWFARGGPVFGVKGRDGHLRALEDPNPDSAWEGPIQVWVGPQTMSACEALAQSIRDRSEQALVVGWPTYGKGTVQRRVEMDRWAARTGAKSRLGELWITSHELFDVYGQSLQIQGVSLDWQLPGGVGEQWGEEMIDGAMPPSTAPPSSSSRRVPIDAWMHPGMEDEALLPLWRRAGLELLPPRTTIKKGNPGV